MMQVHHEYKKVLETETVILAISVDGQENAKIMKEKTGVQFDILCDSNLDVIKLYGLSDEEPMNWDYTDGKTRKSKEARTISLSANILINQKGFIQSNWSGHYNSRPSIESTLEILKKM